MESTLSPAHSLRFLSNSFNSSSTNRTLLSLLHTRRLSTATPAASPFLRYLITRRLAPALHLSLFHQLASASASASTRALCHPSRCFSSSADFGGGGGSVGGGGGGGGAGGGDGSESGGSNVGELPGAVNDVAALSPDAIILDVGGMTCGGCAAKVKKILEKQPHVSSASVNLATETAIIWLAAEAKVMPNWQERLGEMLAKHLTNCGFESNLRGQGDMEGEIAQ